MAQTEGPSLTGSEQRRRRCSYRIAGRVVQASVSMITVVMAPSIVVVMMPLSPPFVMAVPIVISPISMTIVDDGRGSVKTGRFVNDGRRGWTPAEWIEIDVELYAGIRGGTRQQRNYRETQCSNTVILHVMIPSFGSRRAGRATSASRRGSCVTAMAEDLVGRLFLAIGHLGVQRRKCVREPFDRRRMSLHDIRIRI